MTGRSGRKRTNRRLTDNASTSIAAEADEIWHSTAISDSAVFAENIPPTGDGRKTNKSAKKSGREATASKTDGNRDPDPELSPRRFSPIVINRSSGHAFLSSVLQKCGYIIRQPNASNDLFYDVMKFHMTLADWLEENEDEMKRTETDSSKFLKALTAYLSERSNFLLALRPTKHKTELMQPSLLGCLMGIAPLQQEILKIAIPILAEAAFSTEDEDISLVLTTLNELKGHPLTVDCKSLCDKFLTLMDSAVLQSQCHIIRTIPEILPSSVHSYAAEKLLERYEDNESQSQINIALLDCFSAMDLPPGNWPKIRDSAIERMANAPLCDIPTYISFLFQEDNKDYLNEIITMIREKVKFSPDDRNPKNDAAQSEILEKIDYFISLNPTIVNIWIKLVKDDLQQGLIDNIKKIDLLILFIVSEIHKQAVNVLKLIFAEKELTIKLFTEMMEKNKLMVYQIFSTISDILESLFRSKVSKLSETVSEITVILFRGLGPLEAQRLMESMTSILTNYPPARDTVFQILTKLAETDPKKLLHFAQNIMAVLDYILEFRPPQIKELMNILAILSQTEETNANGQTNQLRTELHILIRKQLTHSDIKIRCFGVISALAMVRQIAFRPSEDIDQMDRLLKLAWELVEKDEDACGIFLDELGLIASALPSHVCKRFLDILMEKFEELWVLEMKERDQMRKYSRSNSLDLIPSFDANQECAEEDRSIVIFENKPLKMKSGCIPAHWQVLARLAEKVDPDGDLKDIDALLGCPILFPKLEEYYARNSIRDISYEQRSKLGNYLVLAINFFRESVSAFAKNGNRELRVKVWLRLEHIVKLQKYLVKHFDLFPNLPLAYTSDKTIGSLSRDGAGPSGFSAFKVPTASKPKGVKRGLKKPTSKKARKEREESDEEVEESFVQGAATKRRNPAVVKINLEDEIQPKQIFPHLRKFGKSVFESLLLQPLRPDGEIVNFTDILMNLTVASRDPSEMERVEKFNPETLTLILTELKSQINDDRAKLNVLSVTKLLRCVCWQIDEIYGMLEKSEEGGAASITEERQMKLEGCLRLLICIMTYYLESLKKLEKKEKEDMILKTKRVLFKLAQVGERKSEVSSLAEVMSVIASFLRGLVSVIKNPVTALDHMKLLKTLHDLLDDCAEIKRAIEESALIYLRNDWKLSSSQVDGILKIWLVTHQSPMEVIQHLTEKLTTVDEENSKIPNTSTYKSCTVANFHTWYAALLSSLSQYVYKKLRRRGPFEEQISEWMEAVGVFQRLVTVTKTNHKQLILGALLKNCRMFVDAFNSGGAELLPQYFKQDAGEAIRFCKLLQISCRTIQHICEYSKKICDSQLLKRVPLVKRTIEMFVWKVREVIALSGGVAAFTVGYLKHRDLEGNVISSQIYDAEDLTDDSDSDDGDPPNLRRDDPVPSCSSRPQMECESDRESERMDVDDDDEEESD